MRLMMLIGMLALQGAAYAGNDQDALAEAWRMIDDGALVIDVRSPEEYAGGHIDGAVNVPHTETDALAAAIGDDHDRAVVVYCGSGRRAGIAQAALAERGYTGVHNGLGYQALEAAQPE
ncbi:MAG: rhodanese-like domain-containing protein [Xanthomonadales bacterium]|nr:rhodanese-like domain-containing protein [Xanthomonadales bacterium]